MRMMCHPRTASPLLSPSVPMGTFTTSPPFAVQIERRDQIGHGLRLDQDVSQIRRFDEGVVLVGREHVGRMDHGDDGVVVEASMAEMGWTEAERTERWVRGDGRSHASRDTHYKN